MNPMQIISMIKNGSNPEQLMMNFLSQTNNPIGANLLQLAQQGNGTEIERVARNIVTQRGGDFDKEFNSFKQMLGIK